MRLLGDLLRLECAACGAPIEGASRPLCARCAARLPWWRRADGCPRCGMPFDPGVPGSDAGWGDPRGGTAGCPACLVEGSPLHVCVTATRYADPLPRLILAFKNPRGPFGPRPAVRRVVDYLADEAASRIERELTVSPDLVVPIPLHPARLRRRGYNHADLIARRVGRRLGLPFDPALLERVRDTGSQAGRAARERRASLRGAFHVRARPGPRAGRILLVDDVLTTGSTLDAAANALLAAEVGEVWALTLSATVARRQARSTSDPYDPPASAPTPR